MSSLQLEGALAFSERKVKDQLTTIDSLQVRVSAKQQLVAPAQRAGPLPARISMHWARLSERTFRRRRCCLHLV